MSLISSFNEVDIKPNSLVIVDIDETTLKYDEVNELWWQRVFDSFYDIHKHYDKSYQLSYDYWYDFVAKNLPEHTDYDGFVNMVKRVNNNNSEIIFVTARNTDMKQITIDHLKHVNIDTDKYEIYFTSQGKKSPIIQELFNKRDKTNIIFVDDAPHNHEDVKLHFGDKVYCYKFQMNP